MFLEKSNCSGKDEGFPGLVPLIRQYLDSADVDVDTRCTVSQYLNFISVRFFRIAREFAVYLVSFSSRNEPLVKFGR